MNPSLRLTKLIALFTLICLSFTTNAFIFAIGRLLAGLGRAVWGGLGFLARGVGFLGRGLLRGAGRLLFGKVAPGPAAPEAGAYAGGFSAMQVPSQCPSTQFSAAKALAAPAQ